jgi:hypothetical protein
MIINTQNRLWLDINHTKISKVWLKKYFFKAKINKKSKIHTFLKNYLKNSLFDLRETCSTHEFTYNSIVYIVTKSIF